VLAAVRRIAGTDNLGEFGGAALGELHRLVSFDHGAFNEVDPVSRRARFDVYPPSAPVPAWGFDTYERYLPHNPIFEHTNRSRDGSARRLSDFVDHSELQRLPLYTDVLEPLGVRYQVAISLAYRRPLIVALSLSRSDSDFTDDDLGVLDLVRPHLSRIYRRLRGSAETLEGSWGLTPREMQVLEAAATGADLHAIAVRLGISVRTIDKHLQHVYRKLGVTNRAAATAAAAMRWQR
jgi:DNA-binding CsgD family transcriptional regulator